jgi:hypothetical protein
VSGAAHPTVPVGSAVQPPGVLAVMGPSGWRKAVAGAEPFLGRPLPADLPIYPDHALRPDLRSCRQSGTPR